MKPSGESIFWEYAKKTLSQISNSYSPLNLKVSSDQCQYAPNSINTESRGKAMTIIEMITYGRILWSFDKFSQPIC